MTHIPYKGAGPAPMMDLWAAMCLSARSPFPLLAQQIRAGTVRALAVSAEKRLPNFPDIPTFKGTGLR